MRDAALMLYTAINAVLQFILLIVLGSQLLKAVIDGVSGFDWFFYLLYAVMLVMCISVTIYLLYRLLSKYTGQFVALWLIALAQALIFFMIWLEFKLYLLFGFRLATRFGFNKLKHIDFIHDLGLTPAFIGAIVSLLVGFALLQRIGLWAITKKFDKLLPTRVDLISPRIKKRAGVYTLLSIGIFAFIEIQIDRTHYFLSVFPFLSGIQRQFVDRLRDTSFADRYRQKPVPVMLKKPNILFLLVESLRGDMFNPVNMPRTTRLFDRLSSCLVSSHHYSAGNMTNNAVFSIFYGVNPTNGDNLEYMDVVPYSTRVLKENGYRLIGHTNSVSVKVIVDPQNLFDRFDEAVKLSAMDDLNLAEDIRQQLASMSSANQPLFSFNFFYSTHYPYNYLPQFDRFQPAAADSSVNLLFSADGSSINPQTRQALMNRYKNSVLFIDDLIASLLEEALPLFEKGDLAIVMTGDHGEELGEFGAYGHAAARFENVRIMTPLVICLPGIPKTQIDLSYHMDIFETVFTWASQANPLTYKNRDTKGIEGISLLSPRDKDAITVMTGHQYEERISSAVIIDPQRKYFVDKDRNVTDQIDLIKVTDHDDKEIHLSDQELASCKQRSSMLYHAFLDKPHY